MSSAALAAIVLTVLLGLLAALQVALAAGAPLGRFAWGGGEERPGARVRAASAVTVLLYTGMAVVALVRAGVLGDAATALPVVILAWLVVALLAASVALNALSRSPRERYLMAPVALLLALLALLVAVG